MLRRIAVERCCRKRAVVARGIAYHAAVGNARHGCPGIRQSSRCHASKSWARRYATSNAQVGANRAAGRSKEPGIKHAVLGGFVVTVGGTFVWLHHELGGLEGLWRAASFYSLAIPKYVQYRYHVWRQSPPDTWHELDQVTSQQGLHKILELRGFYIKCGQMCASNIGNGFPEIWQDTMSVLQDNVPPREFAVIRDIVQHELGQPIHEIFDSFDETPVGSASIGQVHRAVLKGSRQPVVVKVCYPDVERLLRGDVRTIKTFAKLAQPVHVPALEEIEKQFQTEFDYLQEAEQLNKVRDNLIKAGLAGPDKLCLVPQAYMKHCTTRVLVMEEMKGQKLRVELQKDAFRFARRKTTNSGEEVVRELQREQQEADQHGKKLQGPSATQYDMMIGLLDSKRRIQNGWNRLYNIAFGWWPSVTPRSYDDKSTLPLNHAQLVDDLLYIHGWEILVDGFFNGDPHPGNCLLVRADDGTPQLSLIDYGQVKRLSKEKRHLFCKLIIALDDDDKDRIVQLMKDAGFRSKHMDPEVIYLYAKLGYDQDDKHLTRGKHIQMFMEELEKRDPISRLPNDYIMIGRASLILRGLAHALRQSRSCAHSWRPIAERVLRENL